ncbi:MAG TPA: PIG-L family deacetylase [Flavobacteriaceae bacterium]|nr:PIG-L family deacetylase [Flavobacteriaceae bacterium]
MRTISFLLLYFICFEFGFSQAPPKADSGEIFHEIQKLNFLGSVLYIAAHPDDENTQLISYFSKEKNARTAYLSLTRGDGGQNLIGSELREILGVIRTQELLSARRIDGGMQFFTRANDFGYSKNPQETLSIWDEHEVLGDVVRIIRKFRPDVIINRFNVESAGKTHGHHTSSAILSTKAFELAADPTKFPEQLYDLQTWQPKRLFFNTSWWFYGSKEAFQHAMEKTEFLSVDVGKYNPLSGFSISEIAAKSRSQHKSQGFGVAGSRGKELEYLQPLKGEFTENASSVFSGIDTSWNRLENGAAIGKILAKVQKEYDFQNPAKNVPKLLQAYQLIQNLNDSHWKAVKSEAIKNIILQASGIYLDISSAEETAVPGENIELVLEAINRSDMDVELQSIEFPKANFEGKTNKVLHNNLDFQQKWTLQLPENTPVSNPYWLEKKGSIGMYEVEDKEMIGLPETPPALIATVNFLVNGIPLQIDKPVLYKTTDPVQGEIHRAFRIVPKLSVKIEDEMLIFNSETPKEIQVKVHAFQNNLQGKLSLSAPSNWTVSPESIDMKILSKNSEKTASFFITPPETADEAYIRPIFTTNGISFSEQLILIDYPHISTRQVLLPAKTKVVRLNIQKKGEKVAYIEGAGDVVANGIEQMGYNVSRFSPEEITAEKINDFDAVVIGIRAYNTSETLDSKQPILFDFVKNGGTMIVQYNTSRELKTDQLAPYELQLSRDRVTDENSTVKFLAKEHPVLNFPNKITSKDFEGWVQERGLYFPDKWSSEFIPILGMNDAGESQMNGSLLVAKYGKGFYIYTGLSFFREFPAGVSGAYRLFANLLSVGK